MSKPFRGFAKKPSPSTTHYPPKSCDCVMRLAERELARVLQGEILRCGHCNALVWFDETFWPDMEYQYIRSSKPCDTLPLKISVWMVKGLVNGQSR